MKIYTYSVISVSFDAFADRVPYVVAILEDEEGIRRAGIITDYKEGQKVEIGTAVKVSGEGESGYLICSFA